MNRDELMAELKRHVVVVVHIPQGFQTVCECGEWRSGGFELLAKAYDGHLNHVIDAVLPLIEADVLEREYADDRWSKSDLRDVSDWLIKEADQRVEFFPQRRDGVDALIRHIAARIARGADHG